MFFVTSKTSQLSSIRDSGRGANDSDDAEAEAWQNFEACVRGMPKLVDVIRTLNINIFRFSLFTFVKGNDALRHALRSRGSRLLKEAMERVIAKKRSGTTESSSEEEEEKRLQL